jgi:predicted methyltransferase
MNWKCFLAGLTTSKTARRARNKNNRGKAMRCGFALVMAAFFAAGFLAPNRASAAKKKDAAEADATQATDIPLEKIPQFVKNAVNSSDRPAADRQLDPGRKPEQMLAFFGIEHGMKVADLWAAGGYTTELLARTVGPSGKVYSQNGEMPVEDAWKTRLKEPGMSQIVELYKPFTDPDDILPVPANSLDVVISNMNYHDMIGGGYNMRRINAAVFNSLKPGGIYGIIDNSAAPGSGARDVSTLHRVDEAYEVSQIKSAGLTLQAASDALRNPKDDRTWMVFMHRGEQDRFMLKFIKPRGVGGLENTWPQVKRSRDEPDDSGTRRRRPNPNAQPTVLVEHGSL